MPLPEPNTEWPPPGLAKAHQDMTAWAAWWSGDPDALSIVYGGTQAKTKETSWARREGIVGAIQRWFWGQQTTPGEQRTKLHVPVAAEIAQVSADLLFGAPPAITVEDKATQDAVDRLMGEDIHTQLYDGAEACSALGGAYMRVGFDREVVPDGPILSVIDADVAFPVFRYGRLWEVTFLSEWEDDGGVYFRHLQHHSVQRGDGLVEHALYVGDATRLGRQVPLSEHPSTEIMGDSIVELQDGRQGVLTGLTRLNVVFVPNARSRTWRRQPEAKDLGRADISGQEPALDALDDTWSSWMRDIRHGRSRLHVPQVYMSSKGPGKGGTVDLDREVYVPLNAMPDASGGNLQIQAHQFAIRFAEHAATATALLERVVSGAGYSPQTFGLADTSALTAMESWNRQTRTQNTRAAKVRRWRIALRQVTQLMVELDRAQFGGRGNPELVPDVVFQETVAESQKTRAETANLLSAAKAASQETLVRMMHPDWDDTQVQAELRKIRDEQPVVVSPLAAAFGGDSEEPDDQPAPDDDEAPADEPPADEDAA